MERVYQLIKEANKACQTADHLIYVTYPIINDKKLMVTITENLYIALTKAMEALLYYDVLFKRIRQYPDDFYIKLEIFKKSATKYNIERNYILLLKDIKEIIDYKEKSKVDFMRKNQFIFASLDYKMKKIDLPKIKNYLSQTKLFLDKINKIVTQNDRIFRK